jgi:four helix bundle protein
MIVRQILLRFDVRTHEKLGFRRGTFSATRRSVNAKTQELRDRVKQFAVRVVRFVRTLPPTTEAREIGRQLLCAATSVSANYHATNRARSRAEFVAKLGIVLEEADESEHWLDVMTQTDIARGEEVDWLRDESRQLRAIFAQAVRTARANQRRRR